MLLSNDGSGRRAGQIQLHVAFAGKTFCLVALLSLLEVGKGNTYAVWRNNSSQVAAIPLRPVLTSCVYAHNDQRVTTLIPLPWSKLRFAVARVSCQYRLFVGSFLAITGFFLAAITGFFGAGIASVCQVKSNVVKSIPASCT